ncbi:MAG: hypothetical protein AAB420_02435 [Patescibacteria group bacterium]
MPGTKILNIQKNDSFDEVFDAFSRTDAQEVIFIFPKGTAFGRDASHFDAIKAEAEKSGKLISVMSADPNIIEQASANGMTILQAATPKKRDPAVAELAATRRKQQVIAVAPEDAGKRIRDIVSLENDRDVKIQEADEEEQDIEISRPPEIPETVEPPATPPPPPPAPIVRPVPAAPVSGNFTDIERLWEEEEKRQTPGVIGNSPKPRRKFFGSISKKFFIIPFVLAVLVLAATMYVTLGHAKVIITPRTQDVSFKLKITASATIQDVQAEFDKIPGQQFSIQKDVAGSYPSTSQKEVAQKATGKIRIYNTSKESQKLVATTRFATKEGLIFRIPATITVPASGSIESVANADRPGKEYNIGPARFTIPGFEGTPRYDLFYAVSSEPMTGGLIGTAKVVSEQDYIKAQEELTTKAKQEAVLALKEQLGNFTTFEPYDITVGIPIVNAKAGEAADSLEMKIQASVSTIAFRPDDVLLLIQRYLDKNGNLELITKDLDVSHKLLSTDTTTKSVRFETTVKGRAAGKLDQQKILKEIPGMNETDLESYFKSIDEVFKAKIMLSPFWVSDVPKNPKKIELSIDISS